MEKIKDVKKPNQFKILLGLTRASLRSTLRNKSSLFFNFFFPFIFITVFGIIGSENLSFDIALTENSSQEGPVIEGLKEVEVVNVITDKKDDEIFDDLNKGRLALALDLEEKEEFGYNLKIFKSVASPELANTLDSIVNGIVSSINLSTIPEESRIITLEQELVEGRKYKQIDFILPGQLAFALLVNALFGISFAIVGMKKDLIIKRIFASPAKKWTILFSEALAKFVVGLMQAILVITIGYFVFEFTLANGFVTASVMIFLSMIGLLVFLPMGLLVASVSKNEDAVSPFANGIMMPQLFLSGAFFPLEAFPAFLQPIAKVLPMTLLNDSFKMVAFEGVSVVETFPKIGILLIWALVLYVINILIFKWD
jgi:ABC-2 type transport system permease protein